MRGLCALVGLLCVLAVAHASKEPWTAEDEAAMVGSLAEGVDANANDADALIEVGDQVFSRPTSNFSPGQIARLRRLKRRCNGAKKRYKGCVKKPSAIRRDSCRKRRRHVIKRRCNRLARYASILWKHYRKCARARKRHARMYSHLATQAKLRSCNKRKTPFKRRRCRRRVLRRRTKSIVRTWKKCRAAKLGAFYHTLKNKMGHECKTLREAYKDVFGGTFLAKKTAACNSLYGTGKYKHLASECINKAKAQKTFTLNNVKKCEKRVSDMKNAYKTYMKASARPKFLAKWRAQNRKQRRKCRNLHHKARKAKRTARVALLKKCSTQTTPKAIKACLKPFLDARRAANIAAGKCSSARRKAAHATKIKIRSWRSSKHAAYNVLKPYIKKFAKQQKQTMKAYLSKQNAVRRARLAAESAQLAKKKAAAVLKKLKARMNKYSSISTKALKQAKWYRWKARRRKRALRRAYRRHRRALRRARRHIAKLVNILVQHGWSTASAATKAKKAKKAAATHSYTKTICSRKKVCKKGNRKDCYAKRKSAATTAKCSKFTTKQTRSQCRARVYALCMQKNCHVKKVCKKCTCSRRTWKSCKSTARVARRTRICAALKKKKGVSTKKCMGRLLRACRKRKCTCSKA